MRGREGKLERVVEGVDAFIHAMKRL